MTRLEKFLSKYFDLLMFLGLLMWLSIFHIAGTSGVWLQYGSNLSVLLVSQFPILAYAVLKHGWQEDSFKKKLLYWLACFGFALPVFNLLAWGFMSQYPPYFFLEAFLACLTLELLLLFNRWYKQRVQYISWVKRISLENAVMVTVLLLAFTISFMGASSYGDPRYHTSKQLLIGFEFNLVSLFTHFDIFIILFLQFTFIYLCGYFFFFLNSRFLVPVLLKKRGLVQYVLGMLAAVALFYPFITELLIRLPLNGLLGRDIFNTNPFEFENAAGAIGIILFSLPIVLSLQWARQNSRIVLLEREKSQAELSLLKQQLNPHFFFNTLNNLYSLSLQRSEQTSESILRLSDLMRFVIYKGQEPVVSIHAEVNYLEDYIQLQMMRLRNPLNYTFEKYIEDENIAIAPLLLVIFVENAFKHGIETAEENARLQLSLHADAKKIHFTCENSFETREHSTSGIGLSNLQKRLELLYPGRHILTITTGKHNFTAKLTLMFDDGLPDR